MKPDARSLSLKRKIAISLLSLNALALLLGGGFAAVSSLWPPQTAQAECDVRQNVRGAVIAGIACLLVFGLNALLMFKYPGKRPLLWLTIAVFVVLSLMTYYLYVAIWFVAGFCPD